MDNPVWTGITAHFRRAFVVESWPKPRFASSNGKESNYDTPGYPTRAASHVRRLGASIATYVHRHVNKRTHTHTASSSSCQFFKMKILSLAHFSCSVFFKLVYKPLRCNSPTLCCSLCVFHSLLHRRPACLQLLGLFCRR